MPCGDSLTYNIMPHGDKVKEVGGWGWGERELASEATLESVAAFDNTELTCLLLSGHLVDIESNVLVHQTEMNQLSLTYNASW